MKRFLKIVERIVGYSILLAVIIAVVMIVGQPQTTGGNQDAFSGSTDQKKRLAVFLDGTWNQVNSNTNVWRMNSLSPEQRIKYLQGGFGLRMHVWDGTGET